MSEIAATEQPQAGAETPPEPSLDATLQANIDALFDANDRRDASAERAQVQDRAPDGKFSAPAGSKETSSTDRPEGQAPGTAEPSTEAPASWSADAKALWPTLPPALQAVIAAREGEAHKRITSDGERLKGYESLEQVIGPRRAALAQGFGSEAAAIKALFDLSDFAGRDFPGFVRHLAQQRGVNLRDLIEPTEQAAPGQPVDPQLAALQTKLDSLERKLSADEQAKQDAETRHVAATLAEFAGKKTSDGKPMYPHFEKVRVTMGRLMATGEANSLEQAYTRAVRLDDDLFAEAQKAEAEARKAAEDAEAKRKAEEARKASKSDPRSRSGSPGNAPRTLDDTIRAEIDMRNAGVA